MLRRLFSCLVVFLFFATPVLAVAPCSETTNPEFNPLRPYPAKPCDPLIPINREPEISFACGKSLNTEGDVIVNPGDLRCPDDPSKVCKSLDFNVKIDLSPTQIPILGNTEDSSLDDATKINSYLSYYLNGTVQQSDQVPIDPNRLINYSGPIKKLLPQQAQEDIRSTVATIPIGDQYHNYLTSPETRLTSTSLLSPFFQNIPFATLEDTAGEITISALPGNHQAPDVSDLKLSIIGGDARIYTPHVKNIVALSQIITSIIHPKPGLNPKNPLLVSQPLAQSQGHSDLTPIVSDFDISQPNNNSSVIPGRPAPTPPFDSGDFHPTAYDQTCDLKDFRINSGDSLHGQSITAHLTYTQKFTPPKPGLGRVPAGGICIADSDCQTGVCQADKTCVTRTQPTKAKVAVFTKLPFVDEIYKTLVTQPDSLLRRFLPGRNDKPDPNFPCSSEYLVGDGGSNQTACLGNTTPAAGGAAYSIINSNVSNAKAGAGDDTGGAQVFFGRLGSLMNYILGDSTENKNLQRLLRPKENNPTSSTCTASSTLPSLPNQNSVCQTCNFNFPSESMQKIFLAAASYYQVPTSVLVGIFYNEGGLNNRQKLTDSYIISASGPNCQVPEEDCGGHMSREGATGPWQFIPKYWDSISSGLANDLVKAGVSDGRIPNICNFLDSTFAAAKALQQGKFGNPNYINNQCVGVSLNRGSSSANGCSWSQSDIVTAARQYLGYCEDPQNPDPKFSPRPACLSNPNSCYQTNVLNIASCRVSP